MPDCCDPHHLLRRKIISLSFFSFWFQNFSGRGIVLDMLLFQLIIVYDICRLHSIFVWRQRLYISFSQSFRFMFLSSLIYLCYYFWASFTITVTVNFLYDIATNCWHGNAQFSLCRIISVLLQDIPVLLTLMIRLGLWTVEKFNFKIYWLKPHEFYRLCQLKLTKCPRSRLLVKYMRFFSKSCRKVYLIEFTNWPLLLPVNRNIWENLKNQNLFRICE